MPTNVRVDMVSDLTCPWCAIALANMRQAMRQLQAEVQVDLHLQPLELYPGLGLLGEERAPYLSLQQRTTRSTSQHCWADIRLHGLATQLDMGKQEPHMLYNTLDAHRLLQWADSQGDGLQLALAQQLVRAYFELGSDISSHKELAKAAVAAGMNGSAALAYLGAGEDSQAVRDAQSFYRGMGITTVPTFIFNHRQLLRGNHPPEGFVRALRHVAATETPPSIV